MNKKTKSAAILICALQLMGAVPFTASAAAPQISISTISVGENHSLVIKSDNSLWAAGDNSKGQLGLGVNTDSSNGSKVMEKVVYVEANNDVSFAIDSNGVLYGWGDNTEGQINPDISLPYIYEPQKLMENISEVEAGDTHTLVLTKDGEVYGWGGNEYGELAFDVNYKANNAVKLIDKAVDIAAGDGFSVIVTESGEVFTCGNNEKGQLGTGSYVDISDLKRVITSGAVKADAGNKHILVLMSDGSVKGCGLNEYGQLGVNFDSETVNYFERVKLSGASEIFAGGNSSGAIIDGVLYTWGENTNGQLHNSGSENIYKPEKTVSSAVSAAFGEHHSLVLKNNGKISSAGLGIYGELFAEGENRTLKPMFVKEKIKVYSAGQNHAAAIDAGNRLYMWGDNSCGQLGFGDTSSRNSPTLLKLDETPENVWCGDKVTFVQTVTGKIYVFGDNSSGMLGMKTSTKYVLKPVNNRYLSDESISKIECGDGYVLAIASGNLLGWGTNTANRLCNNEKNVVYPTLISDTLSNIVDVAAGDVHVLALSKEGILYGWGSNVRNQISESKERQFDEPKVIELKDRKEQPLTVMAIDAASSHSMAITTDYDLYVWGSNSSGQLNSETYKFSAPAFSMYGVEKAYTNGSFSAVVNFSGKLMLCGDNTYGQLGNGTMDSESYYGKPIATNITDVSLGKDFGGYIDLNNKLYCWGNNTCGQLGTGRGGLSSEPKTVIENGLCLKTINAEILELNKTELSLKKGKTEKLTAVITPADASDKSVTWSSSDNSVATVDNTGLVKAVKVGKAVITAKTSNGLTAQCIVKVEFPVTSFTVSPAKTKTLDIDGTFTFKSKIYPANADNKTLLYSSSNEDVAVVDENGTVTAISAGTAKIMITAQSNPSKTRTVTVKVRPDKVKITSKESDEEGITLAWEQSEYAEGYVIYRRKSAKGKGYVMGEVNSDDPDELVFTDSTGTKGKYYYYYIKSFVTVDGKRIYSSASTIYKIKAK